MSRHLLIFHADELRENVVKNAPVFLSFINNLNDDDDDDDDNYDDDDDDDDGGDDDDEVNNSNTTLVMQSWNEAFKLNCRICSVVRRLHAQPIYLSTISSLLPRISQRLCI